MKLPEQALLYLDKAAEDEVLVDEVISSPRVSDAVIGFHCQQAEAPQSSPVPLESQIQKNLRSAGVVGPAG